MIIILSIDNFSSDGAHTNIKYTVEILEKSDFLKIAFKVRIEL